MFPYRIQIHQKLSEADKNRRKEMGKVLLDKIEEPDTFLKNLWTTDEAHFHLDVKRCKIEWPPYTPDLSPTDFYLWGYLKNKEYEEKPRGLNQLKEKIKDEISAIEGPVLKAVMQNFTLRIKKCIEVNGGHREHIL
ncbi:hypothetical protein LOD99_11216 [Oopsacas minuta]|uniref:Transposase n=1 Tax=Oopsacas minuta TaxID=111878 RepID=A0AAV7K755_9METZ|nr:hypothetical protein LOD99_11216 [Oopsacas minuta]